MSNIFKEITEGDAELDDVEYGACLPATQENIDAIPEMWISQIKYDKCSLCGEKIFYRDNMPEHIKYACLHCMYAMMAEEEDNTLLFNKSAAEELMEYFKKKEQN